MCCEDDSSFIDKTSVSSKSLTSCSSSYISSSTSASGNSCSSRTSNSSNSEASIKSCNLSNSKPKSELAGSFYEDYQRLCRGKQRHPINFFKLNSNKENLNLCADSLKLRDWEVIITALRADTRLKSICIQNRRVSTVNGNFDEIDTREKAQNFNRKPVILTRFLMRKLLLALSSILGRTSVLDSLQLEALPLRGDNIVMLSRGLSKCASLSRLALPSCMIGDEACSVLCKTLKNLPNIKVLDLTCCSLSPAGVESLVQVITCQQLSRSGECWERCLRNGTVDVDSIAGLRRITLNHNNLIGDEGAMKIIESLIDDNFIKAVDLQNCRLTENIGLGLLKLIQANKNLVVVDVRLNKMSEEFVREFMAKLPMGEGKTRWQWIRETHDSRIWKSCPKVCRKPFRVRSQITGAQSKTSSCQTMDSSLNNEISSVSIEDGSVNGVELELQLTRSITESSTTSQEAESSKMGNQKCVDPSEYRRVSSSNMSQIARDWVPETLKTIALRHVDVDNKIGERCWHDESCAYHGSAEGCATVSGGGKVDAMSVKDSECTICRVDNRLKTLITAVDSLLTLKRTEDSKIAYLQSVPVQTETSLSTSLSPRQHELEHLKSDHYSFDSQSCDTTCESESILRTVFLSKRKIREVQKTNRKSSDSNPHLDALSQSTKKSSSISDSFPPSSSAFSGSTDAFSASTNSSRAALIKLLLDPHNYGGTRVPFQGSTCKTLSSQYANDSELLEAIS